MFSKNNKISKRQMFRLLTYDLLGIGTLLLPTALAQRAGKNAMLSIASGIAAGIMFTLFLGWVIESMKEGERYPDYLRRSMGKFFGTVVLLGYILYYLLIGGGAAYVFGRLMVTNLLKEQSFYWIVAGILALVIYGLMQGIEGRARVYEILFWFLMLPLGLMLFFAAGNIELPRLCPLYEAEGRGIWQGAGLTFTVFSLGGFSLFLVPFAGEKKKIRGACLGAVLLCGGVLLVLQGILQGMFGIKAMTSLEYPVVTLMSMIQIPGGFLQRQDALMVAVWFFTVFALISSSLFYASETMKDLCGRKKGSWCVLFCAVLVFALAVGCYRSQTLAKLLFRLFFFIGTPFAVGIPLLTKICMLLRRKGSGMVHVLLVVCSVFFLTGCSTMELENRNFPLAMGVDKEEDACRISYKFQDLSQVANQNAGGSTATDFYITDQDFFTGVSKYANDTNKILDYNHMKVLILSEDFVEDTQALEKFLQVCQKEELMARNTLLFFAEDAGAILALDKNTDTSIGSYLEELMESREDYKLKDAVTLGDLYNETANREQLLLVPVLREAGGLPVIRNYYAVSGGVPKGEVRIQDAVLACLSQGKLKKLSFTLEDGTPVKLERICQRGCFSRGSQICYEVKLKLEAAVEQNSKKTGEDGREYASEIAGMFQKELEQTKEQLLDASGIDMTDSFYRLGTCSREKYETYQGDLENYNRDLQTKFEVEVVLLN